MGGGGGGGGDPEKGSKERREGWGGYPSVSKGGGGYTHTLYLPDHWDVTRT